MPNPLRRCHNVVWRAKHIQETSRSCDVVVLGSIDGFWGNSRYLPTQLHLRSKRIAQWPSYLVLPGFAPLLRRARPVVTPAPLRGTVGLVAAHRHTGTHLCVPLSSHLQLLCLVYELEVIDFCTLEFWIVSPVPAILTFTFWSI